MTNNLTARVVAMVDPAMRDELHRRAAEQERTPSYLVRVALRRYLDELNAQPAKAA